MMPKLANRTGTDRAPRGGISLCELWLRDRARNQRARTCGSQATQRRCFVSDAGYHSRSGWPGSCGLVGPPSGTSAPPLLRLVDNNRLRLVVPAAAVNRSNDTRLPRSAVAPHKPFLRSIPPSALLTRNASPSTTLGCPGRCPPRLARGLRSDFVL